MPILTLQRRHAEQGRIRLGVKVPVGDRGKMRPEKLDRFRFTSGNRSLIEAIAELYGGEARPWDNAGKPEHEVITDATTIPVLAVKGGFSQWLELWDKGGVRHRCDGETNVLTDELCDPGDPDHLAARPTTRLSVMLAEVESLGVWRLESHGWNAAAELPTMAELAQAVGDLVPATLSLSERRKVADGRTSRFVVPVLDLRVTKARLVELATGLTGDAPALPAAPDYAAAALAAGSVEECKRVWDEAARAGALDDGLRAAITARASGLASPLPGVEGEPVDEATGEIVERAASRADVDRMLKAFTAAGVTSDPRSPEGRAERLDRIAEVAGRPVEKTSDLTFAEVEAVITALTDVPVEDPPAIEDEEPQP